MGPTYDPFGQGSDDNDSFWIYLGLFTAAFIVAVLLA